ncbi:MAG: hypothetical protein ACO2O5_06640 [Candidatus Caldipriscus sp.]
MFSFSEEDKEILRGAYEWIMLSEDGKEWERVALILVRDPYIVEGIEGALESGHDEGAVFMVATLLGEKWGVPSYWVDEKKSAVREEWKRSRIIHLWDYYPEKKNWKISPVVERWWGMTGVVIFEI